MSQEASDGIEKAIPLLDRAENLVHSSDIFCYIRYLSFASNSKKN